MTRAWILCCAIDVVWPLVHAGFSLVGSLFLTGLETMCADLRAFRNTLAQGEG